MISVITQQSLVAFSLITFQFVHRLNIKDAACYKMMLARF